MLYIQLIGLLAFCILVLSYYKKTTTQILTYQITSNIIYALHYFLLGGLSGAFISVIATIRNIVFIKLKNNKIIIMLIFVLLYLIVTILFYEKFYSIFPMCANVIYLISIIKNSKKSILIGSIMASLFWILYAIFVLSYIGIITESLLIVSNVIQLIKTNNKTNT